MSLGGGNSEALMADGDLPDVRLVKRTLTNENRMWRVYADHIRGSDGTEVEDYLVIAPKSARDDLIGGVTVLPIQDGKLVLLRSYRHAVERFEWEAPRGFVDLGEEPAIAALRELEEEAGLLCVAENLRSLGALAPEAGTIRARVALFAALDCKPGGTIDGSELGLGRPHSFTVGEVEAMLSRFEIDDATTLAAIHGYLRLARADLTPTAPVQVS